MKKNYGEIHTEIKWHFQVYENTEDKMTHNVLQASDFLEWTVKKIKIIGAFQWSNCLTKHNMKMWGEINTIIGPYLCQLSPWMLKR